MSGRHHHELPSLDFVRFRDALASFVVDPTFIEALDAWERGLRFPPDAAAVIERDRERLARDYQWPPPKLSLGEIVTGVCLVPGACALVAFFSLVDEADAATCTVAAAVVDWPAVAVALLILCAGVALGRARRRPHLAAPSRVVLADHPDAREALRAAAAARARRP